MFFKDTQILKFEDNSLNFAKNLILNGDLVAFATETVYGLGALATSDSAVKKIFEVKGRPSDNPLIVHVHKNYDITKLVYIDFDYVYELQKAFLPGPLTMVFRSKGVVSSLVSCGLDTLAIRVPKHKDCQRFLKFVDAPICAPSANLSKHTSPVKAEHVYNDLKGKIHLILDGGKCSGGIESTVLDCTTKTPRILRSGLITCEMIKGVVGSCEYAKHLNTDKVMSPGTKYEHYSPKCLTDFFERDNLLNAQKLYDEQTSLGKKVYFLCDNEIASKLNGNKLLLGTTGEEIASNLYNKLLEGEKVADLIIGISVNTGTELDVGILNRFEKACKKS